MPATRDEKSIASFTIVIGTPAGIGSAVFSFAFSMATGIVKKLLKTILNKKNYNKIFMLARNKLNSIAKYLRH